VRLGIVHPDEAVGQGFDPDLLEGAAREGAARLGHPREDATATNGSALDHTLEGILNGFPAPGTPGDGAPRPGSLAARYGSPR
jgi:hypothetical protein